MRSFFNSLRRLGTEFWSAMCKMNDIQFSAPWAQRRSRSRCH
jgi:hypothetical protein